MSRVLKINSHLIYLIKLLHFWQSARKPMLALDKVDDSSDGFQCKTQMTLLCSISPIPDINMNVCIDLSLSPHDI